MWSWTPRSLPRATTLPQRCYSAGTLPTTYQKGHCQRCECKLGYGGDYCQLHVINANFTYQPHHDKTYIYNTMTQSLLFDKFIDELSLSFINFPKNQIEIVSHNRTAHSIIARLYTGLDFFHHNEELSVTQPYFTTLANNNNNNNNLPPPQFNPTLPTSLDNLYTQ